MPPHRPPGDPSEPLRQARARHTVCAELWKLTRALLVGALGPLAGSLLLIPVCAIAAWVGLLVIAAAVGWFTGRDAGTAAGVSAGVAFMWVHGPERFAATVSDPWIIRFGFLLAAAGVAAALLADLWHRHRRRVPPTVDGVALWRC
jgi:hypothetical protein